MSVIAGKRELRESIYCWFVRAGATVDGDTVSSTYKPDVDPTDNWPELGCVLKASIEVQTVDDPERYCPIAAGGYSLTRTSRITGGVIILELAESNNLVRELRWGVPAEIDDEVSQRPMAEGHDPAVFGWLKGHVLNPAGAVQDKFDWWVRMTLESGPDIQPDLQFPRVRCEKQQSDGNVYQPML